MPQTHHDLIREQFTQQATPFSTAKSIANDEALRLRVDLTGAGPEETMRDVGCGGGLVVCAFAPDALDVAVLVGDRVAA